MARWARFLGLTENVNLPNAKDQPDHGIKFLRAGVVAINFMSWSRMHPFVGQLFSLMVALKISIVRGHVYLAIFLMPETT